MSICKNWVSNQNHQISLVMRDFCKNLIHHQFFTCIVAKSIFFYIFSLARISHKPLGNLETSCSISQKSWGEMRASPTWTHTLFHGGKMKNLLIRFLVIGSVFAVLSMVKIFSPKELRDCFSKGNISSDIERLESWKVNSPKEETAACQHILQQTFYQLATGTQFHAFASEDGQYVLKFFRHARWRLSSLVAAIPLPFFMDKKRQQWISKKATSRFDTFQSCALAYRAFKKEMGIVYLQLSPPGDIETTVTVVDRLGKESEIDLNEVDFVLQHRAICTNDYLLKLRKKQSDKRSQASN